MPVPYVGILRAAGLAKEPSVGTLTTPPDIYIPYIAPEGGFSPVINLLESKGIRAIPDVVYKATQGPGSINAAKLKLEVEPENIGQILMAALGTDTPTETAGFVVSAGVNDKINFKESGGAQLTATLAAGTYAIGTTSATNGSLCKAVKTAMDAAAGAIHTYTVTYSYSTKKMTITPNAGTLQILWLTGTNQATAAYTLLGWTHTDTSDASAQTSNSTTQVAAFSHLFTRLAASQLPTYTWWFDKGAKYLQFPGSMLHKLDLNIKAKEFVECDTEWVALSYDDTGITHTPSYSQLKPLTFYQAVVTVASGGVLLYDNIKVTIDNMVKADHTLKGSIYPGVIYSEGMIITIAMDLVFEDATEYAKFLAGTATSLNVVLTSGEIIGGTLPYTLTIDIPNIMYMAAPLPNVKDLLKISFTARGIYSLANTKTISVALQNSVSTSY